MVAKSQNLRKLLIRNIKILVKSIPGKQLFDGINSKLRRIIVAKSAITKHRKKILIYYITNLDFIIKLCNITNRKVTERLDISAAGFSRYYYTRKEVNLYNVRNNRVKKKV